MNITDTLIRTHGIHLGVPAVLLTDNGSGHQLAALRALSTPITLQHKKTNEGDTSFLARTLRLKLQLGKELDKDIAWRIGLSNHAWVLRKKRDSFPVKEVELLAARKPELKLDVNYILYGARS